MVYEQIFILVVIIYCIRLIVKRRKMANNNSFYDVVQLFATLFICWGVIFFGITTYTDSVEVIWLVNIIDTFVFVLIALFSGLRIYQNKFQNKSLKSNFNVFKAKHQFHIFAITICFEGLVIGYGYIAAFNAQGITALIFFVIGILLTIEVISRVYKNRALFR